MLWCNKKQDFLRVLRAAIGLDYILCLWSENTRTEWNKWCAKKCKQQQKRRWTLSVEGHLSWSSCCMHNSICFTSISKFLFVLLASLSSTQYETASSLCVNVVYCKEENALQVYSQNKSDLIWRYLNDRSRMEKFFYHIGYEPAIF